MLQALASPKPSGSALLEVQSNKLLFDWQQMQRWGIDESMLPMGSEVRFRVLTAWQQYRMYILGVVAVLLG